MGLRLGDPDGALADEYDLEARAIVDTMPEDADVGEVARVIAEVITRKFGTGPTHGKCASVANDLTKRWSMLED